MVSGSTFFPPRGGIVIKRSDWFYIWVAITSYLTGPLVYSVSLWLIQGEHTKDMGRLITWTAPAFFSVGILLYLLCVIFLRSINKYYFWLQTLAFVIIGLIPVYIVPLISGFFYFSNVYFLFTREGSLFLLFFSSIAFVCSYGTWIAQKKLNKKIFLFISISILVLFIIVNSTFAA